MTNDYYLRIRLDQLSVLRFLHLSSDIDLFAEESAGSCQQEGAARAQPICGFTEWLSEAQPAHSIGWDWVMAAPDGQLRVKDHTLRTNIMLIDGQGLDMGRQETEAALLKLVSNWGWPEQVLSSLQVASLPMN